MENIEDIIRASDVSIFRVKSQTTIQDRRSLLDLQNIVRMFDERYVYLEVGSHLGGTLLPYIYDPKCRAVISVDSRPAEQDDERGRSYEYENNSTARMISGLEAVAPRDGLLKLRTFDADASELSVDQIGTLTRIAFIDGEHTNRACFKDFMSVLPFMEQDSLIAFHDANLVFDALSNIETFLESSEIPFSAMFLPDSVYTIGVRKMARALEPLKRYSLDADEFVKTARRSLRNSILAHAPR